MWNNEHVYRGTFEKKKECIIYTLFLFCQEFFWKNLQKLLSFKNYYIKIVKKGRCNYVVEYMKQLNKIMKAVEEIPYKEVHIAITTKTDAYVIDKIKETKIIGFKVGEEIE